MKNDRDNLDLSQAFAKGADCLDENLLTAVAEDRGTPAAKAHVEACTYCATEVEIFRSFVLAQPTALEAADLALIEKRLRTAPEWRQQAQPAKQSWWATLFTSPKAGFALAGMAAVLLLGVMLQRPNPDAILLTDPGPDLVRSTQIEGLAPLGDLAQAPSTLQWQPVSGAVKYKVALQEVDNTVIWQTELSQNQADLPPAARNLMADRKTLHWSITAFDNKGTILATSGQETFRVVRSKP